MNLPPNLEKKGLYFNNMVTNLGTSTTKMWDNIHPYLNPNKKKSRISPIMSNSVCYNTAADLVKLFTKFFTNALKGFTFMSLDSCKWYVNLHFLNYKTSNPDKLNCNKSLEFQSISVENLKKHLKDINPKSSEGHIGIPSIVFKHCADELSAPLLSVLNHCLDCNFIADDFKIAHVIPVYKGKGKKNSTDNYRPVSVLSPIAKIFECLIGIQMTDHFELNNFFSPIVSLALEQKCHVRMP